MTNLFGPFLTIQQAARRMIAQGDGGRIINITSVHEEACFAGAPAYDFQLPIPHSLLPAFR